LSIFVRLAAWTVETVLEVLSFKTSKECPPTPALRTEFFVFQQPYLFQQRSPASVTNIVIDIVQRGTSIAEYDLVAGFIVFLESVQALMMPNFVADFIIVIYRTVIF
jgi:hypothetical protein